MLLRQQSEHQFTRILLSLSFQAPSSPSSCDDDSVSSPFVCSYASLLSLSPFLSVCFCIFNFLHCLLASLFASFQPPLFPFISLDCSSMVVCWLEFLGCAVHFTRGIQHLSIKESLSFSLFFCHSGDMVHLRFSLLSSLSSSKCPLECVRAQ